MASPPVRRVGPGRPGRQAPRSPGRASERRFVVLGRGGNDCGAKGRRRPTDRGRYRPHLLGGSRHGDEGRVVVCEAGHDFYQAACEAIDAHGEDYDYFINHIREKTGREDNRLYMPVRIALTGVLHGPDLDKVLKLVGSDQARVRFDQVMDLCHSH